MKTAMFKIGGQPADGDMLLLAYTTPRGGMSNAKHYYKGAQRYPVLEGEQAVIKEVPAETPEDITKALALYINTEGGEYCKGQFSARAVGDMLVVSCSDFVDDVTFISQWQGRGAGTVEQV